MEKYLNAQRIIHVDDIYRSYICCFQLARGVVCREEETSPSSRTSRARPSRHPFVIASAKAPRASSAPPYSSGSRRCYVEVIIARHESRVTLDGVIRMPFPVNPNGPLCWSSMFEESPPRDSLRRVFGPPSRGHRSNS